MRRFFGKEKEEKSEDLLDGSDKGRDTRHYSEADERARLEADKLRAMLIEKDQLQERLNNAGDELNDAELTLENRITKFLGIVKPLEELLKDTTQDLDTVSSSAVDSEQYKKYFSGLVYVHQQETIKLQAHLLELRTTVTERIREFNELASTARKNPQENAREEGPENRELSEFEKLSNSIQKGNQEIEQIKALCKKKREQISTFNMRVEIMEIELHNTKEKAQKAIGQLNTLTEAVNKKHNKKAAAYSAKSASFDKFVMENETSQSQREFLFNRIKTVKSSPNNNETLYELDIQRKQELSKLRDDPKISPRAMQVKYKQLKEDNGLECLRSKLLNEINTISEDFNIDALSRESKIEESASLPQQLHQIGKEALAQKNADVLKRKSPQEQKFFDLLAHIPIHEIQQGTPLDEKMWAQMENEQAARIAAEQERERLERERAATTLQTKFRDKLARDKEKELRKAKQEENKNRLDASIRSYTEAQQQTSSQKSKLNRNYGLSMLGVVAAAGIAVGVAFALTALTITVGIATGGAAFGLAAIATGVYAYKRNKIKKTEREHFRQYEKNNRKYQVDGIDSGGAGLDLNQPLLQQRVGHAHDDSSHGSYNPPVLPLRDAHREDSGNWLATGIEDEYKHDDKAPEPSEQTYGNSGQGPRPGGRGNSKV